MLIKISVQNLHVGMYVVDSGLSEIDYPGLYSVEGRVKSEHEIRKIRKQGYRDVFIDTEKSESACMQSSKDI
jgi:hypothetical protein